MGLRHKTRFWWLNEWVNWSWGNGDWSWRGPKCKGFERNQKKGEREKRGLISVYDFQSIEKDSCSHLYVQKGKKQKLVKGVRFSSDTVWMQLWCLPVEWLWLTRRVACLNFRSSYLIEDSNVCLAHWYGLETIYLKCLHESWSVFTAAFIRWPGLLLLD